MGPKAPKDPVEKRPALYILVDTVIEGSPRENGKFQDICYLNGRIVQKITVLCDQVSPEILKAVQTCAGFRKIVHSIGISVTATKKEYQKTCVHFALNSLSKIPGGAGTTYSCEVPCDGREVKLLLDSYELEETDDILGSFVTTFEAHETAKLTVCFYLNDGYSVPVITPDPLVDFTSKAYQEMIKRSLVSAGNTERIRKAVQKAQNGEQITIAYLGGSITQGAGAKPIHTESYAYQSYLWFKDKYGKGNGENVHFVKAGAGGTSSEFGVTRYEKDVLCDGEIKPDILFLEYAVNDAGDETDGVCFESLVKKALLGPGTPAVILLFAVFMDDFNLQDRMIPVGERYMLPMISLKNAVTEQFSSEKPVLTKRQYFYDLFHPSNTGHRIMADCIINLFLCAEEQQMEEEPDYSAFPQVKGTDYAGLITVDRANLAKVQELRGLSYGAFSKTDCVLQCVERDANMKATPEFPDNFYKPAGKTGEPFSITLFCRDVLLVFKDSGDPSFGKAEVRVDDNITKTINPLEVGWTHCNAAIVFRSKEAAEHKITVSMASGEEDKAFTILGVSYTI